MNEKGKVKKDIPFGVKVISILGILISAAAIIFGILLLFVAVFQGSVGQNFLGIVLGPMLIIPGIVVFILSLFLLKGRNWARITFIVLFFIYSVEITNIIGLISKGIIFTWWILLFIAPMISLILALYLLLNKKVKEAFR